MIISRDEIIAKQVDISESFWKRCNICGAYVCNDKMHRACFKIANLENTGGWRKDEYGDPRLQYEEVYCTNCIKNEDQAIKHFKKSYSKYVERMEICEYCGGKRLPDKINCPSCGATYEKEMY